MRRIVLLLSSGLGLGYLPKAPGTFGTLWGVGLFYFLREQSFEVFFLIVFCLAILAVYLSHLSNRYLGVHDSPKIVIDEVVGYLVAVLGFSYDLKIAVVAFVAFRAFDIIKPYPIKQIDQKCSSGLGVVLDDVVAGLFANVVMRAIFYFWR